MLERTCITLVLIAVATTVGTEIARSIVHRRRERLRGIGGTQDIAIVGMLVSAMCYLAAAVCGIILALKN